MKSEKIKIEIDLLRDSLRNVFVVMFAVMSGEMTLIYRVFHNKSKLSDYVLIGLGFISLLIMVNIKNKKSKEIRNLLERIEK
jgi:hypothetical protein